MRFSTERYSDTLVNEIMPLLSRHYRELADEFYGPLNPDLAIYKKMDEMGALRIFTIRDENILVGYQIFFLGTHPHSKDFYEATQDVMYLTPEARRGLTGYKFLKWCTEQLATYSVNVIHQRISARNDFGPILERMGFQLEDLTYSKKLEVA